MGDSCANGSRPGRMERRPDVVEQVVLEAKYSGYVDRQAVEVDRFRRMEGKAIPAHLDFASIPQLRVEAREKLTRVRPTNLGPSKPHQRHHPGGPRSAVVLSGMSRYGGNPPAGESRVAGVTRWVGRERLAVSARLSQTPWIPSTAQPTAAPIVAVSPVSPFDRNPEKWQTGVICVGWVADGRSDRVGRMLKPHAGKVYRLIRCVGRRKRGNPGKGCQGCEGVPLREPGSPGRRRSLR